MHLGAVSRLPRPAHKPEQGKGPGSHHFLVLAFADEVEIWPIIIKEELCTFLVSLLIRKFTDEACLIQLKES